MGNEKISYNHWIVWEKEFLREHYYDMSKEDLMLNLSRHSWVGIKHKAVRLGLKKNPYKPVLSVDENFFKTWTNEMSYIFGFWIADGNMWEKAHSISFASKDSDLLKMIKTILKSDHRISREHLRIGSKTMYDDILKLGGIPVKSLTIEFPFVSDEFLPDFIRGFLDGDGGVYFYKNYPSIRFTGNKDFLKVLKEKITEHVGIDANSFDIAQKNILNRSQKIYYLGYYGKKAIILGDYIYQNSEKLRLERKFKKYDNAKKEYMKKGDEN